MLGAVDHQPVYVLLLPGMKGEVVEARAAAVMTLGRQRRGLLHHDVLVPGAPATAGRPVLVSLVAEGSEEPPPAADGLGDVRDPDLDVVQAPPGHRGSLRSGRRWSQPGTRVRTSTQASMPTMMRYHWGKLPTSQLRIVKRAARLSRNILRSPTADDEAAVARGTDEERAAFIASIIAQLGAKARTDQDLLTKVIDANIAD
jgi:hypothetical protein